MDVVNKKREQKAREKSISKKELKKEREGVSKEGTVSFSYDKGPKKARKVGDKKTSKKFVGVKDQDDLKSKKKVYQNKDGATSHKPKDSKDKGDKTNSQMRRQKQKVSDLIKKLRINYNKLLMKKKELKQTNESKAALVQECIDAIGDKFEDLIYKHDGCRIVQAMIKHGSVKQKELIIDSIKEHVVELMTKKYSNHLTQKAYYYAPKPEQKKYIRS